jgi:hypothetical protein
MELAEFAGIVGDLPQRSHAETIILLGWFLHTHNGDSRFAGAQVLKCYDDLDLQRPSSIGPYLAQLSGGKNPSLLKDKSGYRLAAAIRGKVEAQYGEKQRIVQVTKLLTELPNKVPRLAERAFLEEAIICFKHGAFRASIVMAWNLAYDHLLHWIMADVARLAAFNANIIVQCPHHKKVTIAAVTDFEDLKESEVIKIAAGSNVVTKNLKKMLEEKLTRRNLAAHPTELTVTQAQAEDVITDLIHNVVLTLA